MRLDDPMVSLDLSQSPRSSGRRTRARWLWAAATSAMLLVAGGAGFAQEVAPEAAEEAVPATKPPGPAAKVKPRSPATKPLAQATPPAAAPAAQAPASSSTALPNGASSISETYGDWTVNCGIGASGKTCILSQAQGNKETNQRTFAIELRSPRDGKTEGTVLMPFGLRLDAGGVLKLDDKDMAQGLRFATCVPQGCLLPVSFPTATTDGMKNAKTLAVSALNLANGQAVTFNVSLDGFGAALARTVQLGN